MNPHQLIALAFIIAIFLGFWFGYKFYKSFIIPFLVHEKRMDFLTGINVLIVTTSGMNAENQRCEREGIFPKYSQTDFDKLVEEFRNKYLKEEK